MRRPAVGIGNWITIAALTASIVVYAVRLEGRQDAVDVRLSERERLDEQIQAHHREADARILAELAYIRARLDQALDAR
mgnify:CR=1 FL=1